MTMTIIKTEKHHVTQLCFGKFSHSVTLTKYVLWPWLLRHTVDVYVVTTNTAFRPHVYFYQLDLASVDSQFLIEELDRIMGDYEAGL